MKKIITAVLSIAFVSVTFLACRKAAPETSAKPVSFLSARQQAELSQKFKTYYKNRVQSGTEANANGARFIVPFFSTEAYGFIYVDPATPDVMQVAFFAAELSGSDFYRENPDGTVSVHISCQNAETYYFPDINDPNGVMLYGTGGRYSSNYTGPVLDLGGGYKIIDLENPRNAVITGSGKVREENSSVWKTVLLRFIANQGGVRETVFHVR